MLGVRCLLFYFINSSIYLQPSIELRSILPTKKRMGRGRARILSQHAANQAEQVKQFPTSTARNVSMGTPKESPFQHPFEHPTGSTDFGTTLFDDSDVS